MKVVVVSHGLAPHFGGSAVSEASLCAELQRRADTVVLCRRHAVDWQFVRGFRLTGVKEYDSFSVLGALLQPHHPLRRCFDNAAVVHINGHWRWENYVFARLCRLRAIPYVVQPRGMLWVGHRKIWLKRVFNALLGKSIVRNAAGLIALSQFETRQWVPYVSQKAWAIIPNGIDRTAVPISKSVFEKPSFLYLGRIEARKNLLFLVRAFQKYVSQGGSANLVLIGPVERHYDRAIMKLVESLNLDSRVVIKPPVYGDCKTLLFSQALAVIYPSEAEPFGRVPFEVIAAGGLPILPRESGAAEYLGRWLPEFLFSLEKEQELVECLRRTETKSSKRDHGLAQARCWVREQLNWPSIVEQVLQFYSRNTCLAEA